MKKWAFLTVFLYAVALIVMIVPALVIAFAGNENMTFKTSLGVYRVWFFWICVAVLVAGQALLLLLPIDISERRFTPRRPLKMPVIVTSFFVGLLFLQDSIRSFAPVLKTAGFSCSTRLMIGSSSRTPLRKERKQTITSSHPKSVSGLEVS